MKISIAMATYNGAKYLNAQLLSFLAQTRQPDEVVITDDCSTDETGTVIENFAQQAPFEVIFSRNEQNLGYCGNFNAALMKTTGDLVFLSDQDDVWFPEKIEHMIGVAESHPEALVLMNDAALTDAALNDVGLTKVGQIRSAGFLTDSFVMGCCCIIRREFLDFCMPVPQGLNGHDNWLVWVADGLDAKIVDRKVLQYYRRHESNESQFIANTTTKVTRLKVFLHSVKSLFQMDTSYVARTQVGQLKIFLNGVKTIIKNAPEKYRAQLAELQKRTECKIETAECRMVLRGKWFVPRVIAAFRLLASGGYQGTSGLKAVLRDLVGL